MKLTKEIDPKSEYVEGAPFRALPALKRLGDLADAKPMIIVDTREQTPLKFTRLEAMSGTLTTGDYSLSGGETLFAIERKSIADLVACCIGDNRDRFERELHRLRGYRFKRLVICGPRSDVVNHFYRSAIDPGAVLSTLSAFEVRYEVPVCWFESPEVAAVQVEEWAWWMAREIVEHANSLKRGTL